MIKHIIVYSLQLIIILFIVEPFSLKTSELSQIVGNHLPCLQSFDDFAFGGPVNWSQRGAPTIYEWQNEIVVPHESENTHVGYPVYSVELTRLYLEQTEIWIRGWRQESAIWNIYNADTQLWEIVSGSIGDTNLYVGELFLTDDGIVWGRVEWGSQTEISELDTTPVLSKFNEITRRFEFVDLQIKIPIIQQLHYYYGQSYPLWPQIVLDEQGIFWFIINFYGIYSYNPGEQSAVKHTSMIDFPIIDAVLAVDGSLYLSTLSTQINTTRELFALSEGMLLHFDNISGGIDIMNVPTGWPTFNELIVDHYGQLWLGSIGYFDLDGTWQLIHTNVNAYFDNAGDYTWSSPSPILLSSDGKLWFNRYLDGNGDGTAWYNPQNGEGCLFLNEATNIVEDTTGLLWMIANGTLVSYRLD